MGYHKTQGALASCFQTLNWSVSELNTRTNDQTRGSKHALIALFASRWQSREEENGAEQGANGGDEPGVAARGRQRAGAAHAAQPGAALVHLALAHPQHARRLRSRRDTTSWNARSLPA